MNLDLQKTGLVLEGGGMRGVFTCGVLDFMMDHHMQFPYVIGVSAGAVTDCRICLISEGGQSLATLICWQNIIISV